MRNEIRALVVGVVLVATQSWALSPTDQVSNFRLFDHMGGSHQLHYFSDMDAVVLMVQDGTCSAAAQPMDQLKAAQAQRGDAVQYFLLNATGQSRSEVQQSAAAGGLDMPVLMDDAQLVSRGLGVSKAGEVLVVDPKTWRLAYRGDAGEGLTNALDDLQAGREVQVNQVAASGCDLTFVETDGSQISYANTVAPILAENCVSCHRAGGIGPWAMTDHNMVRGFSLMIREVLMTQRMPPWHADPEVGHWSNERALTRNELQTLVHWIDAGAPRGEGADPLTQFASTLPAWGSLGEPDLIVDIPPTQVPTTGTVEYQYKHVKNPLERDVWVRASQILPGDREVLHHVISLFGTLETEGPRKGRLSRKGQSGGLAGYVPGAEARNLPEGTGTLLPAGATMEFQMHYTTTGKASTDHSKIGIYFHDEKPQHQIKSMILANGKIRIPANSKAHSEQAVRVFDKDALMYSLLPHSHYRGKAAKFVAQYPDGTEETLLNVPNYDFNWQTSYQLAEPKFMPAGTKIVFTKWWDNSAQNPANPNPNREVRWGRQSWDEMIFGAISYREVDAQEGDQVAGSE